MTDENKRLKVFVFIESDICTRHFIFSGVLNELTANHDVTFIYPPSDWGRVRIDPKKIELSAPVRHIEIPRHRVYLWKRLFQVQQLMLVPGRDYAERRRCIRYLLGWKAVLQLTAYGLPGIFQVFKRSIASRLSRVPCTNLTQLLTSERPDLVVHPSTFDGYFINDLISESKSAGIPSVLIMNSWDNPSIKQTAAGIPDWCVVWGQQTLAHCRRYMGIPANRLIKHGAAQFDVFQRPPVMSRDAFCQEHGISPSKTIVMYAGSSKGTDEYSHLSRLNDACASGLLENVAILYRPHPWGNCGKDGQRIATVNWQHVSIEHSMLPYVQRVASGDETMFIEAEYARTHEVLTHVDAVISPLSTIIIEAALHNKPPLCFMPLDQEKRGSLFEVFTGLVHFEEMFSSDTFSTAVNIDELLEKTQLLIKLATDKNYLEKLKSELTYFVETSNQPYGHEICKTLEMIHQHNANGNSH